MKKFEIFIMSGIPGSGKSSYIEKIKGDRYIFSADYLFERLPGGYPKENFPFELLGKAHRDCLRGYLLGIQSPDFVVVNNLIVDNTNLSVAEMAPYVEAGLAFGHNVNIVRMNCDPMLAASRNVHGVSEKAILGMNGRMCKKDDLPWHWLNGDMRVNWVEVDVISNCGGFNVLGESVGVAFINPRGI